MTDSKYLSSYLSDLTVNVDCIRNNSSSELLSQQLSAIIPDFQKQLCLSSNMLIDIYPDKQTVNNLYLVAFFTRTCHVLLMKTIAYVTVTLNKNIIERHELFDSLFSTIIMRGGGIR